MTSTTAMDSEDLMAEVTAGMEAVRLPSEDAAGTTAIMMSADPAAAAATTTTGRSLPVSSQRPLDRLGPPADPVPFGNPVLQRGKRADVLCYNSTTQTHEVAKDVLFQDFGSSDDSLCKVQRAYWSLPFKEPIKTIMGHVQICIVLRRSGSDGSGTGAGGGGRANDHGVGNDDHHDDDDDSSSSENDDEDGFGDDEDDIVFEMTKEYVAIKVNYCERIEKLRNKHAEDPMKEIAAMQLIGNDHPNVLGCHEVLFDGQNINVVLPYCRDGDLFELLQISQKREVPGLTEPQARYWFRQILAGLHHLERKGVCHRDLSPENVMLDQDGCLIIDMGMCLRVPYLDGKNEIVDVTRGVRKCMIRPQGACGKLPYMSPEIYRNKEAFDGGAVDLWTAGTILFCMLTGNRSYQRAHRTDPQFYWMTNGLTMLLQDWNVQLTDEAVDLLQGLLTTDARDRLTLQEAAQHPWFRHADERPS